MFEDPYLDPCCNDDLETLASGGVSHGATNGAVPKSWISFLACGKAQLYFSLSKTLYRVLNSRFGFEIDATMYHCKGLHFIYVQFNN